MKHDLRRYPDNAAMNVLKIICKASQLPRQLTIDAPTTRITPAHGPPESLWLFFYPYWLFIAAALDIKRPQIEFVDIYFANRLVNEMRLPAPPETLRVARALTALTQQKVAVLAEVTRRYISNAETSQSMFDLNLQLVDFYVTLGIEFVGQASIGTKVSRAGARWLAPDGPAHLGHDRGQFHNERFGISFRAARALLNQSLNEVAAETGLTIAALKGLETGHDWVASSKALQNYYEQNRVEFLGWSDASTRLFYGVGVRWID
ncbi:transcriptional regulator with XRE-family HTH domain [Pararhizobium capsulatum DSM 1112]|uniref:Transcriptional regulator with XRE-family HTH domain n=1 Tax=Pararhizobium capsulatum DSM 1112 TaxID=1121113 RepID=A0ABU0BK25_9HYPH|nr:hypothetical protein [Pararhizobium capsulatum]MDQ0318598.1 transcriptional regulator with XRE-family HTH domain [Pararhizobium capsulatum DSM 1112]